MLAPRSRSSQLGYVEFAKMLLERGADKDLRDKQGNHTTAYAGIAVRKEELLALLARY